jgi:hypothetical protein
MTSNQISDPVVPLRSESSGLSTQDINKVTTNPIIKPLKGARKPIDSGNFRDMFQVDLIDMRECAMKDSYGNLMQWILILKDYSTQLTYLAALPSKKASFVAYELDKIFGLIGYPTTLYMGNGKEDMATEIVELLKEYNNAITTVTGRPRRRRSNTLVKRVINNIMTAERLNKRVPNWTKLLGKVMQTINSKKGRGKHDVEPYWAVFGQPYHQPISCDIETIRKCATIDECLKVTKDERLQQLGEKLCILDETKDFSPPEEPY